MFASERIWAFCFLKDATLRERIRRPTDQGVLSVGMFLSEQRGGFSEGCPK